jgi:hypothetical protein
MDLLTFTRLEDAEDAVGSVLTHDGARRLVHFIPMALEEASALAIQAGDAFVALHNVASLSPYRKVGPVPWRLYPVRLRGCLIAGPFGPLGNAVKTAALEDERRFEEWLEDWRRAMDA